MCGGVVRRQVLDGLLSQRAWAAREGRATTTTTNKQQQPTHNNMAPTKPKKRSDQRHGALPSTRCAPLGSFQAPAHTLRDLLAFQQQHQQWQAAKERGARVAGRPGSIWAPPQREKKAPRTTHREEEEEARGGRERGATRYGSQKGPEGELGRYAGGFALSVMAGRLDVLRWWRR